MTEAARWISVRTMRWSLTIVFAVCLTATLLVSLQSNQNDANLERSLRVQQETIIKVDANTRALRLAVNDICEASNTAARGTNEVLQTLIDAVTATKAIPPAEKVDRVRRYRAAMVAPIQCPRA